MKECLGKYWKVPTFEETVEELKMPVGPPFYGFLIVEDEQQRVIEYED